MCSPGTSKTPKTNTKNTDKKGVVTPLTGRYPRLSAAPGGDPGGGFVGGLGCLGPAPGPSGSYLLPVAQGVTRCEDVECIT